jgi:hypothetical protein
MKLCTISLKQSCREVSIGVTRVELALRRWCQAQCHVTRWELRKWGLTSWSANNTANNIIKNNQNQRFIFIAIVVTTFLLVLRTQCIPPAHHHHLAKLVGRLFIIRWSLVGRRSSNRKVFAQFNIAATPTKYRTKYQYISYYYSSHLWYYVLRFFF